jgi:hypothetical protein
VKSDAAAMVHTAEGNELRPTHRRDKRGWGRGWDGEANIGRGRK